jgi:hypothetical protein
VKKASRKTSSCQPKALPTPAQIRRYIECSADEHYFSWQAELISSEPKWVYLLGLHLRLVELEHLETAAGELL